MNRLPASSWASVVLVPLLLAGCAPGAAPAVAEAVPTYRLVHQRVLDALSAGFGVTFAEETPEGLDALSGSCRYHAAAVASDTLFFEDRLSERTVAALGAALGTAFAQPEQDAGRPGGFVVVTTSDAAGATVEVVTKDTTVVTIGVPVSAEPCDASALEGI